MAANSTAALSFDDAKAGREILQAMGSMPAVESAVLFDEFGQRFAAYTRDEGVAQAPERAGTDGFEWHNEDVALYRAVTLNKARIGTIYVRTDLSELELRRRVYATVRVRQGDAGRP